MSEQSIATVEQLIPILEDIVIRLIPKDNMKIYTAKELSKMWEMPVEKIHLLRKYGALKGMKKGKDFGFTHKSVMQFLEDYAEEDISCEDEIRIAVANVRLKNKKKGIA